MTQTSTATSPSCCGYFFMVPVSAHIGLVSDANVSIIDLSSAFLPCFGGIAADRSQKVNIAPGSRNSQPVKELCNSRNSSFARDVNECEHSVFETPCCRNQ
jgi:hypothetical protein